MTAQGYTDPAAVEALTRAQAAPVLTPFCRDCGKHVRLTAFSGGDELACASCEGDEWYYDDASVPTLTTEQLSQIRDCTALIQRGRNGAVPDCIIRGGLIASGWAAGAVIAAFEALERATQCEVEVPAHTVPERGYFALTGQDRGASE